ncbi:UNVERIFIED_CONTAM: hypothetical protein FKN15_035394 [Acipenser sinensis]
MEEEMENPEIVDLPEKQKHQLRHRELFLSRQLESLPATHISHVEYMKDGLKHMRLKFYIEGSEPRIQGTVHSEVRGTLNPESGKYEFRFIFVDIDTYPRRTVVPEDNR